MAIVQSINSVYHFEACFKEAQRGNSFSWEGYKVLFDYLDNLSDDIGEPIEMDVIALCCEYNESTIQEIIDDYNIDVSDADGDEDEIKAIVKEYLQGNTIVCGETSDGFVYACF